MTMETYMSASGTDNQTVFLLTGIKCLQIFESSCRATAQKQDRDDLCRHCTDEQRKLVSIRSCFQIKQGTIGR